MTALPNTNTTDPTTAAVVALLASLAPDQVAALLATTTTTDTRPAPLVAPVAPKAKRPRKAKADTAPKAPAPKAPGIDRDTAPLGPPNCRPAVNAPKAPAPDQVVQVAPNVHIDTTATLQVALAAGVTRYHQGAKAQQALWLYLVLLGVQAGILKLSPTGRWGRGQLDTLVTMLDVHMADVPKDERPKDAKGYMTKATGALRATAPEMVTTPVVGGPDDLWCVALAWVETHGNPVTWSDRNPAPEQDDKAPQGKGDTLDKIVASAMTRTAALGLTTSDLVLALVGTMQADDLEALVGTLASVVAN